MCIRDSPFAESQHLTGGQVSLHHQRVRVCQKQQLPAAFPPLLRRNPADPGHGYPSSILHKAQTAAGFIALLVADEHQLRIQVPGCDRLSVDHPLGICLLYTSRCV